MRNFFLNGSHSKELRTKNLHYRERCPPRPGRLRQRLRDGRGGGNRLLRGPSVLPVHDTLPLGARLADRADRRRGPAHELPRVRLRAEGGVPGLHLGTVGAWADAAVREGGRGGGGGAGGRKVLHHWRDTLRRVSAQYGEKKGRREKYTTIPTPFSFHESELFDKSDGQFHTGPDLPHNAYESCLVEVQPGKVDITEIPLAGKES